MAVENAGKTLIHGASYLFFSRILVIIFTTLNTVFLSRFLGVNDYGLWALANSVLGIFALFGRLPGTNQTIIRYVSKYEAEGKPAMTRILFFTSLKLRFVFIGICCGAVLLLAGYVADTIFNYQELAFVLPVLAIGHFFSSLDLGSMFNALKKFHTVAFLRALKSVVNLLLTALLLLLGWGLRGAAVGHALYIAAMSTLSYFLVSRLLPPSESRIGAERTSFTTTSKRILSYGVPISIVGLLVSLGGHLRSFLLGLNVELELIGYFTVALGTTRLLIMSNSFVMEPLLPVISELEAKKDWATIEKVLSTLLKYMLLTIGVAVILVEVFAPLIISLLFSESFEPAAVFLRMLIVIALPISFTSLSETLFLGIGRSDIVLKISLISSIWKMPTMVLLILSLGVFGATMYSLALVSFNLVIYVYFLRSLGLAPFRFRPLINVVPVLGVVFIILILASQFMILNVTFLVLSSLSASFGSAVLACVTGIVKKEEIEILESVLPANRVFSFMKSFLDRLTRKD